MTLGGVEGLYCNTSVYVSSSELGPHPLPRGRVWLPPGGGGDGVGAMRGRKLFAVVGTCSPLLQRYNANFSLTVSLSSLCLFVKSALTRALTQESCAILGFLDIVNFVNAKKPTIRTIKQRLHALNNVIESYQKMTPGIPFLIHQRALLP
jgi:hypothetical protein